MCGKTTHTMIQANELRIGNWVKRYDGVDIQVSNIGKVGLGLDIGPKGMPIYLEWSKFEPIPLTTEILGKCGFEKQGGTWFFIEYFTDCMEAAEKCGVTINLTTGRCFIFQNDEEEGADGAYLKHRIEHLHQLQNLYFALTGEELNYTP